MRRIFQLVLALGMLLAGLPPARPEVGQAAQAGPAPLVVLAERHDASRPLRDLPAADLSQPDMADFLSTDRTRLPLHKPVQPASQVVAADAAPQADLSVPVGTMPSPLTQWDGQMNLNNSGPLFPPDPSGAVGPNHYVQWVNTSLAIWNKQGTKLLGPVAGNQIWAGFGGACEYTNDGDPVVLYDRLADRWLISQFALPETDPNPYWQCMAISQTPDPTGAWFRYAFLWSVSNRALAKMNDYPKFGIWPDGYYMSVNQFTYSQNWAGAGVAVFERDRMLAGLSARMVSFDLYAVNPDFGGMLPADMDGATAPPAGSPNVFAEWDDSYYFGGSDALRLWNFHVDWANTANSTFGNSGQPNQVIATQDLTPAPATGDLSGWITQPPNGATAAPKLDSLNDRLMYRLQYRNFGGYQALVGNHTVAVGGAARAGIHWFELRKTTLADWSLFQQGVHSPDAKNRWVGSLAMDGSGNIALGYSLSDGTSTYPSVAYAGRLAADPVNTLPQGEVILAQGNYSQTHFQSNLGYGRWGDYSMLTLDPSDDCTFWYTQEYYQVAPADIYKGYNWRTVIGSFKFPTCTAPSTGYLQGTVRQLDTTPISGAKIQSGDKTAYSAADGTYAIVLPTGSNSVTVSASGYISQTQTVSIVKVGVNTLDVTLSHQTLHKVSGKVGDAGRTGGPGGATMPLFARLDITNYPASPIYTDPLTGYYEVMLSQGDPYTFTVSSVSGGYTPANWPVTIPAADTVHDFGLVVDSAACTALGYVKISGTCTKQAGGLVVGKVQDANNPPFTTPFALAGASVTDGANLRSAQTMTTPTKGLYLLFTETGSRSLTAAFTGYPSQTQSVLVATDSTVQANFTLPAGSIRTSITQVEVYVDKTHTVINTPVVFQNYGTLAATFTLTQNSGLAADLLPKGPFAPAGRRLSPSHLGDRSAASVQVYIPPEAQPWPGGGSVLGAWQTGLAAPWGITMTPGGEVWISDVQADGGDGNLHAYTRAGLPLGSTSTLAVKSAFAADLAYDPVRERAWQVDADVSNCMLEVDLSGSQISGQICPPLGVSQRGLAYDPASQTFFSGSWNDAVLAHFDRGGVLLDSVNLGLNFAGLAFHPDSRHLYALSNAAAGYDVYVLEAQYPYQVLGGFDVPGLSDFGQAGLEMTPDGHLWVVDSRTHQVLEVSTGEAPFSAQVVPTWLSAAPTTGSLAVGASQTVSVTVDIRSNLDMLKANHDFYAYFSVSTDTPYDNTSYRTAPVQVIVHTPKLVFVPTVKK